MRYAAGLFFAVLMQAPAAQANQQNLRICELRLAEGRRFWRPGKLIDVRPFRNGDLKILEISTSPRRYVLVSLNQKPERSSDIGAAVYRYEVDETRFLHGSGFEILRSHAVGNHIFLLGWEGAGVWNTYGKLTRFFCAPDVASLCGDLSHGGDRVVMGLDDGTLELNSVHDGKKISAAAFHESVQSAIFSPNGNRIAAADRKLLQIRDTADLALLRSLDLGRVLGESGIDYPEAFSVHNDSILFTPNGKSVIVLMGGRPSRDGTGEWRRLLLQMDTDRDDIELLSELPARAGHGDVEGVKTAATDDGQMVSLGWIERDRSDCICRQS
jgi:WD40 repeat protein